MGLALVLGVVVGRVAVTVAEAVAAVTVPDIHTVELGTVPDTELVPMDQAPGSAGDEVELELSVVPTPPLLLYCDHCLVRFPANNPSLLPGG